MLLQLHTCEFTIKFNFWILKITSQFFYYCIFFNFNRCTYKYVFIYTFTTPTSVSCKFLNSVLESKFNANFYSFLFKWQNSCLQSMLSLFILKLKSYLTSVTKYHIDFTNFSAVLFCTMRLVYPVIKKMNSYWKLFQLYPITLTHPKQSKPKCGRNFYFVAEIT